MKTEEISKILKTMKDSDGTLRVKSHERSDLEFKETFDENYFRKSVKTIAAFANARGGRIIFGVTDNPRTVKGINKSDLIDPAKIDDLLSKHLCPVPYIEMHEHELDGKILFEVNVLPAHRPPILATKDLHTKGSSSKIVLNGGCIYNRRSGKTAPMEGSEFIALMERRDTSVRDSILGVLSRAKDIGFDNVAVANLSEHEKEGENLTLYVPEEAARNLNILNRGKLVEDSGAPAYEIKGGVTLTTFSKKDARKPLLPEPAARSLRPAIEQIFWKGFPWVATHLRKAAAHLGYWDKPEGDNRHTGTDELTNSPKYFEKGRKSVLSFAENNPDAFVDAVGSQKTKNEWRRRQAEPK